jgi:hypothetical protein
MESTTGKSEPLQMSRCRALLAGIALLLVMPSVWAQCDVQTPIEPNDSVAGTLADSDCTIQELAGGQVDDISFVDLYRVTLPVRGILKILMTSDEIDSFLWLSDENLETLIDVNDDSGGGSNARIVRVLEAGTYIILANEFARQPGSYTLRTNFVEVYPAIAPALQLLFEDEDAQ